jgi:hypothetical protein
MRYEEASRTACTEPPPGSHGAERSGTNPFLVPLSEYIRAHPRTSDHAPIARDRPHCLRAIRLIGLIASHARGRWFKPSRAHHLSLPGLPRRRDVATTSVPKPTNLALQLPVAYRVNVWRNSWRQGLSRKLLVVLTAFAPLAV